MLKAFGRTKLVIVGDTGNHRFNGVCEVLGLSVQHLSIDKIQLNAQDLLAIVVFVDENDPLSTQGQLVQLITQNIFEYGIALIVASFNGALAIALRANALAALAKRRGSRLLQPSLAEFVVISPVEKPHLDYDISEEQQLLDQLAHVLRDLDVEPSADSKLEIEVDDGGADWDQDRILIQRAFNGFTEVNLHAESGGRSQGCFVWRINAKKGAEGFEPFIAKAALREDLIYEFNTYRDIVRDHVPFPFRAPLLENRFVKGGSRALLVSSFVTRAQRFDEYLKDNANPELPIAALFHHTLASWRRLPDAAPNVSIGRIYVRSQQQLEEDLKKDPDRRVTGGGPLLPNPSYLQSAHNECVRRKWKSVPASALWAQLQDLPKGDFHITRGHGDLNVRNVFVRWNTTDTILIDFSNSGTSDFLARDPAKLDTSIALTCADRSKRLLSLRILRELYSQPLMPFRKQYSLPDGRVEAIRQVRKQAGGEGITNYEYTVVVACHLLRYASVAPNAVVDTELAPRRAFVYSLACRLIESCK